MSGVEILVDGVTPCFTPHHRRVTSERSVLIVAFGITFIDGVDDDVAVVKMTIYMQVQ